MVSPYQKKLDALGSDIEDQHEEQFETRATAKVLATPAATRKNGDDESDYHVRKA